MTESKLKIFLTDKVGNSFYEENGVVQLQGQPRAISNAPDGFQDIAVGYERNVKYMSLFRGFSFPLGFVKDGASILKHIMYKLGYEFKLYFILLIQELYFNDTQFGLYYNGIYKGEVDFSSYTQEENKITINLMDGGLSAILKANEGTQYEIPLTGKAVKVKMDGVLFQQNADIEIPSINYAGLAANSTVPMLLAKKEGFDVNAEVKAQNGGVLDPTDYFIKANEAITFRMQIHVQWKFNNKTEATYMRLERRKDDNFVEYVYDSGYLGASENIYEANIDQTITLNAGEHLWLHCMCTGTLQTDWGVTYYKTDCRIDYDSKYKTTYVQAKSFFQVGKELLEKMSEGKYTLISPYLESRNDLLLTSGDGLRGFTGSVIKTNWLDWYQSLWSGDDIAFTIKNGNGFIDHLSNFLVTPTFIYNHVTQEPVMTFSSKPTVVGEVRNLKVTLAKEFLFSKIKVGYANQNYEDVNGRAEFNAGQQWTVPITRVATELDLVSPYRADCIGVEYTRINFEGKETSDASTDNDIFILQVEKKPVTDSYGTYFPLDRTVNKYLSGVVSPETMFNVKLSPKHKLLAKGRYLASCLHGLENQVIKFQSSDKNKDMRVDYPTGSVIEGADIPIATLGSKYFIPFYLEYETPYPLDLIDLMNEEDYRRHCLIAKWNDVYQSGFIMKVGMAIWDNEVQTYQLLSSPKNDLSKT
jgi:hypothetical protein